MATVPTKTAPEAAAASAKAKTLQPPRDSLREIAETIVFVVALVLMLKLFVVEAFVIPTGSMAETLLGYNKNTTCPQCGYTFPVNVSHEVDPPDGVARPVLGACCPNCRHTFQMTEAGNPSYRSGDRVLVHKALYNFLDPKRGDVVVFKYPVDPQVQHTAQNYIKRLWGLSEETIAIHRGDLYVARGIDYPASAKNDYGTAKYPRPEDPRFLWEGPEVERQSKTSFKSFGQLLWDEKNGKLPPEQQEPRDGRYHIDFTYYNADTALAAFAASRASGFPGGTGNFELLRKTNDQALAMRRIAFDNSHQATKLAKYRVSPRWQPTSDGWKTDNDTMPKVFTHSGDALTWVRYQHRLPGEPVRVFQPGREFVENPWDKIEHGYEPGLFPPQTITNYLGYNAGFERDGSRAGNGAYWVGDLMLECRAKIGGPNDTVILELGKGSERFRATFTGGQVSVGRSAAEMASMPTKLTSAGEYDLRFANIDGRLRVAVNGRAIDFGTAADYSPAETSRSGPAALLGGFAAPEKDGHTLPNDVLAPAMIGAQGSVEVTKLVLWQDTYFTPMPDGQPETIVDTVDTFYVQPGHYLVLGDNSGQSSDSRKWGLVPERLMLGKAVFVFWPSWLFGPSRIGFID